MGVHKFNSTCSELFSLGINTNSFRMMMKTVIFTLLVLSLTTEARVANYCETAKFKCCSENKISDNSYPIVLRCFEKSGCPGIFIHTNPCDPRTAKVDISKETEVDDPDVDFVLIPLPARDGKQVGRWT